MKKLMIVLLLCLAIVQYSAAFAGSMLFNVSNFTNANVKIVDSGIKPSQSQYKIGPKGEVKMTIKLDDKNQVAGSMAIQITDKSGIYAIQLKFSVDSTGEVHVGTASEQAPGGNPFVGCLVSDTVSTGEKFSLAIYKLSRCP